MIMIIPFVVFMLVPIGGGAAKWIALALFVIASLTDLLDANSVRLDVELQLTAARTRVVYTYYQLLRACGRL